MSSALAVRHHEASDEDDDGPPGGGTAASALIASDYCSPFTAAARVRLHRRTSSHHRLDKLKPS